MDQLAVKSNIRELFTDLLTKIGGSTEFTDEDELISTGRLQSLHVIEIMSFLEDNYKLDLSSYAFDPDDFESVDALSNLIESET